MLIVDSDTRERLEILASVIREDILQLQDREEILSRDIALQQERAESMGELSPNFASYHGRIKDLRQSRGALTGLLAHMDSVLVQCPK